MHHSNDDIDEYKMMKNADVYYISHGVMLCAIDVMMPNGILLPYFRLRQ